MPYKGTKGRAGDALYKTLCHPDNETDYPWASSHTWQSWSNRYRKNQEEFDRNISRYLGSHPEIISQWDPAQSYSKKAARKLGLDVTARDSFQPGGGDDGQSDSDDIPPDFDEEHEINERLLNGDETGSESRMRSPSQSPRPRETTARPRRQVTNDYNDFPEIKEGDDSAPPQWTKQRRHKPPVGQTNLRQHKPSKRRRIAMRQHSNSRSEDGQGRNNEDSGRPNEHKGQLTVGAPTIKNKFVSEHTSPPLALTAFRARGRQDKLEVVLTSLPNDERKKIRRGAWFNLRPCQ